MKWIVKFIKTRYIVFVMIFTSIAIWRSHSDWIVIISGILTLIIAMIPYLADTDYRYHGEKKDENES